MDLLIEILSEIVIEWFFGGAEEAALDRKYSKPVRIFSAVIALIFYLAVFALIAIAGIASVRMHYHIAGVLLFVIDLLLIFLFIRKIVRLVKYRMR